MYNKTAAWASIDLVEPFKLRWQWWSFSLVGSSPVSSSLLDSILLPCSLNLSWQVAQPFEYPKHEVEHQSFVANFSNQTSVHAPRTKENVAIWYNLEAWSKLFMRVWIKWWLDQIQPFCVSSTSSMKTFKQVCSHAHLHCWIPSTWLIIDFMLCTQACTTEFFVILFPMLRNFCYWVIPIEWSGWNSKHFYALKILVSFKNYVTIDLVSK